MRYWSTYGLSNFRLTYWPAYGLSNFRLTQGRTNSSVSSYYGTVVLGLVSWVLDWVLGFHVDRVDDPNT